MMRHRTLVLLASLGLTLPLPAQAAADLTISPAIQQLTIGGSEASIAPSLQITNHAAGVQSLQVEAIDFGTLDQTGGLYLIGQPNDFERKYGLANWLKLDSPTVALQPGETKTIPLTIENRADLSPGGHYAAIVFKQSTGTGASAQANVGLQPELTELLFLRKDGGLHEDILLQGTDLAATRHSLPSTIRLRIKNNGNVHETPRGLVKVFDPLGHEVEQGIINEDSSLILPEATRLYPTRLETEGVAIIPGKYRVVIDYRYEGNDNYTRAEYSFNLEDTPLLVAVGVGLILILAGLIRLGVYLWHRWRRPVPSKPGRRRGF